MADICKTKINNTNEANFDKQMEYTEAHPSCLLVTDNRSKIEIRHHTPVCDVLKVCL